MIAALYIAGLRGTITRAQSDRMEELIHHYGTLPAFEASAAKLVAATGADKKNVGGIRRFVLPIGIGDAGVIEDVTAGELREAAEYMLAQAAPGRTTEKKA